MDDAMQNLLLIINRTGLSGWHENAARQLLFFAMVFAMEGGYADVSGHLLLQAAECVNCNGK